jgi:hypothetical protein
VARNEGDPNWPGPVWGFGAREPYGPDAAADLAARIRPLLFPMYGPMDDGLMDSKS